MRTIYGGLLITLGILGLQCRTTADGEAIFTTYCGGCHALPSPADLPKDRWAESVLPEMGARLGVRTPGYDPFAGMPFAESATIQSKGFYPPRAQISVADWQRLHDYVLANAPDTLPAPPPVVLHPLENVTVDTLDLDARPGALVTYLGAHAHGLLAGTGRGTLHAVGADGQVADRAQFPTSVVDVRTASGRTFVLEMGKIHPTEIASGTLHELRADGTPVPLRQQLHRPVWLLPEDLDGDGHLDLVLAEYGHYTGQLRLLRGRADGTFRDETLHRQPGTLKVLARDLNRDGRPDLISLNAQGDEGVTIFYQQADGSFRRERVLRFNSVWGSSWFDLADMDNDGDLDLLVASGDNADYSHVRKPYHGWRLYRNDGANHFTEAHFQPLPGCTRIVTGDFDRDGDVDLATAAYFPDFAEQPETSFVFWENLDGTRFRARTHPAARAGRWMLLETADATGDGNADLVLGSFAFNPTPAPDTLQRAWNRSRVDGLVISFDEGVPGGAAF